MTVGKWKTELVKDYIKLAEDLKLPIDEERVLDSNRSFSLKTLVYVRLNEFAFI